MRYARNTQVSSDRSIAEIRKTVERYGATGFLFGTSDGVGIVGFQLQNLAIRSLLPMPLMDDFLRTPTGRERDSNSARIEHEKASRQRWRALALVVKAKLEAVESGIATLEDEFLAYILLDGKRTVGEALRSDVANAYFGDKAPKLLPPMLTGQEKNST